MPVPYVVGNQTHKMRDVLEGLLKEHEGCRLDIATVSVAVRIESEKSCIKVGRVWRGNGYAFKTRAGGITLMSPLIGTRGSQVMTDGE